MHKGHRHISILPFFLLLALLNTGNAMAQEEDSVSYGVSIVPPEQAVSNFDSASHEAVRVRTISDSDYRRVRNDDDYWYANTAPEVRKEPPGNEPFGSKIPRWLRSLIWILIVVLFSGALIWYLAAGNIRLFRKAPRPVNSDEDDAVSEDIFALDYEPAIAKAVAEGNYRLAIRLHYLDVLKNLSDRQLISYAQGRTNQYYLDQLSKTTYYRSFFRLTRGFEYSWYGQFPITAEAYAQVRQEFADFKQSLRS